MKTKFYYALILIALVFSINENANAQAPAWQWAKRAGGTGDDRGTGIGVDANGNTYVVGTFKSTSITFGSTTLINASSGGTPDIFIVKYDSSGIVKWAKSAGGIWEERCGGIAVDASGNSYITGSFASDSITFGNTTLINSSISDVFTVKYDSSGNVIWAKRAAGNYSDGANSIAIDSVGNSYIIGGFDGTTFTFGSTVLTNNNFGQIEIFILKYDSSGNPVWAKSAGGHNDDFSTGIAVDINGNVFVTGYFSSASFNISGVILTNLGSLNPDIFIAKYNASGNLMWAKREGSTYDGDASNGIAVDALGNSYITGAFDGLTATFGNIVLTKASMDNDIFIARFDSMGNVTMAKRAGGTLPDQAYGIVLDTGRNIYITGYYVSDTLVFANTILINGGIFIFKYDSSGNEVWAKNPVANFVSEGTSIAIDRDKNSYITGSFYTSINFGGNLLTGAGGKDFYIAKIDSAIKCSAFFSLGPDTIPHNWIAVNMATGVQPLNYLWDWGDGNQSYTSTPSHIYSAPGFYNICLSIYDQVGCAVTYCDSSSYLFKGTNNSVVTLNVVTQSPTGINDLNGNNIGVTLYPNPATNHLTITLPKASQKGSVVITDIKGKIIYNNADVSSQKIEVNTKDFSNGIYFVQIQTPDFVETKKLIIQK